MVRRKRANGVWCEGVPIRAHTLHAITVCSGSLVAAVHASACLDSAKNAD